MKAALITEEQIKAIEDALEMILVSSECEAYFEALAIVKSLKVREPDAWMCPFKYCITDNEVEYVLDHAQDGKDYMMERLDSANNDEWRGEPTPLYAGDQP